MMCSCSIEKWTTCPLKVEGLIFMFKYKQNNIEYQFNFVTIKGNPYVSFHVRHFIDKNCIATLNGNLAINDKKEILWSKDDPANFTPEVKDYMSRILKLIVFS